MGTGTASTIDEQLKILNEKVDNLSEKLSYIAEFTHEQKVRQQERDELKADLIPVINDLYLLLVEQLEDLSTHVQLEDILYLVKRLLRNTKNIERLLDQIESLQDFLNDFSPLARDAFLSLMKNLDELERKGYFAFFKEFITIVDNIVTHFSPEDVRLLADNIVLILDTIKQLTQPDVMTMLREFTDTFREVTEKEEEFDTSTRAILKLLRDPHVKRGLVITMQTLRLISLKRGEIKQKIKENNKNHRR